MTSHFLRYTLLRFLLFAACLATAALVGWWNLQGVIVAILVSAVLSWFLLRAPREELAADIEQRVESRGEASTRRPGGAVKRSRWDLDAEAEDAEADAR